MTNHNDVAIIWRGGRGDIRVENQGVQTDETLTNRVIISLFTDRAVVAEELEEGKTNRGWWGDSFSYSPWGSRLWLLEREKSMESVCEDAEDYAHEALKWMIEEGLVLDVIVTATRISPRNDAVRDLLNLDIQLPLPEGKRVAQRTVKMELINAL